MWLIKLNLLLQVFTLDLRYSRNAGQPQIGSWHPVGNFGNVPFEIMASSVIKEPNVPYEHGPVGETGITIGDAPDHI